MNLQQLKSLVAVSGGVLSLNLDDLESASLTQLFEPYLAGTTLVINNVTQRAETDEGVTVVGTGGNRIFAGMQVTALFRLGSDQGATVFLTARGEREWTFDKSFPALAHSIFADLQFEPSPTLYLSSYQISEEIGTVMSFEGTLVPNSVLGVFGFLIGGAEQRLTGDIYIAGDVPGIVLFGPINASADMGFLKLSNVRYEVYSDPRYDSARFQWIVDAYVGFSADLKFSAQNQEHIITILADVFDPSTSVLFVTNLTEGIDAALDELSALANGVGLSVPFDDFQIKNNIKFTDLKVMVNPNSPQKIGYLTFGVETAEEWTLMDGLLTLEAIDVSFRIDDPLGTPALSGVLSGLFGIGQTGTLELSAIFGELAFGGSLREGDPISIKEVFEYFFDADNSDLPELNVTHFDFNVEPATASYSGLIELEAGAWAIPVGETNLYIEDLKFQLDHSGEESSKLNVLGVFGVGAFQIVIEADYEGVDKGWTFSGSTGEGQAVPLGEFILDLAQVFGTNQEVPASIADLTIRNLHMAFNTLRKDFTFICEASLPIDGREVQIAVSIELKRSANNYSKNFSGTLTIGALNFNLHFSGDNTSSFFLATYSHAGDRQSLNVKELIEYASPSLTKYIPTSLEIELKDVLFAFFKGAGGTKFLFGLDVGTEISLSNLPLVGQQFPPDRKVSVDDLQLLVASKPLSRNEVDDLNNLTRSLPGVTALPAPPADSSSPPADGGNSNVHDAAGSVLIPDGLTVTAQIRFGVSVEPLSLPVGGETAAAGKVDSKPSATMPAPVDSTKWFTVQKSFGPVYFARVGVRYQDAALTFLLDAALSAAGLTLSLEGLSVGSPLNRFAPQFDLRGLGIDYSGGGVEIGAAFLRVHVNKDGEEYDEYDGAAIIKTEAFNLAAIGSYASLNGHPSLFIYAVLNYPLGGPSFFFVTGLAAGFGYNRSLIVPRVEDVAQFPLVAEAVAGVGTPKDLTLELQSLQSYIPPAIGEIFLAIGVKFTSFKMIDSFALLTIAFGSRVEVNVLGISSLVVPTPEAGQKVTPLAEVQMTLKATFIPDEGFLGVSAQLTKSSYVLSRDCHLTGGYAFYSWFSGEHEGDFVQTLGGYHPDFNVPSHYPTVPRLGLNWQVTDNISIKGGLYYALTASTLMAGGDLQAVWEDGDLKAWFNAGAHFLISWKPYHYDAKIYIDMGVSYSFSFFGRHHISVDIGADLHIWGPEFSGQAHIKLWIISFDVTFGSGASERPQPIDWNTFKRSFLPGDDKVCSIAVKDGLVRKLTQDEGDLGVINPKQFSLVTNSAIPFTNAHIHNDLSVSQLYFEMRDSQKILIPFKSETDEGELVQQTSATADSIGRAGIGSMDVVPDNLTSKQTITIKREGKNVETDFEFIPILKNVPAALWGQSLTPDLNGQAFIRQALSGFEIRPKVRSNPGETLAIDRRKLQYADPEMIADAYDWEILNAFTSVSTDETQRRQSIGNSIVSDSTSGVRGQLLQALGVSAEIDLSDEVADAFLITPQIESPAN